MSTALADEIMGYINSSDALLPIDEVEKKFAYVSKGTLSGAMAEVRREATTQVVRKWGRRGLEIFIPSSLAEKYEQEKIPKSTAKGICFGSRKYQDLYPAVCEKFCPSFTTCADGLRAYVERNGVEWTHGDKSDIRSKRLKKFLKERI